MPRARREREHAEGVVEMQILGEARWHAVLQHPRLLRWKLSSPSHYLFIFDHYSSIWQRKRQRTTRALIWFRTTTIQPAETYFQTASWSLKANCAATLTTMRIAANHVEWIRIYNLIALSYDGDSRSTLCCHQLLKCADIKRTRRTSNRFMHAASPSLKNNCKSDIKTHNFLFSNCCDEGAGDDLGRSA